MTRKYRWNEPKEAPLLLMKIGFDIRRMATSIVVERSKPYRWAGVLVDERPLPPWWSLRRRWYNRRYRRVVSRMLSVDIGYDREKLDRRLKKELVKAGVSFA